MPWPAPWWWRWPGGGPGAGWSAAWPRWPSITPSRIREWAAQETAAGHANRRRPKRRLALGRERENLCLLRVWAPLGAPIAARHGKRREKTSMAARDTQRKRCQRRNSAQLRRTWPGTEPPQWLAEQRYGKIPVARSVESGPCQRVNHPVAVHKPGPV